jgi:hypothetical protein
VAASCEKAISCVNKKEKRKSFIFMLLFIYK